MKIEVNKIILICLVLISLLGCRTMKLNQTAETLDPKKAESNFNCSQGFVAHIGVPALGPTLSFGYLQRFGIKDNIELQVKSDFEAWTFFSVYGGLPCLTNFIEFSPKFRVFNKKPNQIAILPSIGIFGGWNFYGFNALTSTYGYGMLGANLGFNFIGSYDLKKKDFVTIYYGFALGVKEDFFNMGNTLSDFYASEGVGNAAVPIFDLDLGLSVGWEIRQKRVHRHEICLSSTFKFYYDYHKETPEYFYRPIGINHSFISLSYNFSFSTVYTYLKD